MCIATHLAGPHIKIAPAYMCLCKLAKNQPQKVIMWTPDVGAPRCMVFIVGGEELEGLIVV